MTEEYECRCGCRFAYELGKYGCPNCGADDGPADLVAAMNDTTRDERLEKDRIRRNDDPEYRAWRYNNDLDHVEGIYEFVDRKVAEAVAARDAEIRAALIKASYSYEVADEFNFLDPDKDGDEYVEFTRPVTIGTISASTRILLNHIGLHGDGTGGQG